MLGRAVPAALEIGAMLETPSLAFAPDAFFALTDFISIGGNDLKQFFFAADRENELVRRRYDTLALSYLGFLETVVARCAASGTPLSFCGEDAGRPLEALAPRRDRHPPALDAPGVDRPGQGAAAPDRPRRGPRRDRGGPRRRRRLGPRRPRDADAAGGARDLTLRRGVRRRGYSSQRRTNPATPSNAPGASARASRRSGLVGGGKSSADAASRLKPNRR